MPARTPMIALAACALHLAGAVQAQEHPFLSEFTLTENTGSITLQWTLVAGSTCAGTKVERSLNGVDFALVHEIFGVCGALAEPVSYNWTDPAPPEFSTVYYRLQLGTNGSSSIRSLQFDQLVTTDQRAYPSPASDMVTIAVRVAQQAEVDLSVWSSAGKLVIALIGEVGPTHELSVKTLPAGVYTYDAVSDGKHFSGRFVKE